MRRHWPLSFRNAVLSAGVLVALAGGATLLAWRVRGAPPGTDAPTTAVPPKDVVQLRPWLGDNGLKVLPFDAASSLSWASDSTVLLIDLAEQHVVATHVRDGREMSRTGRLGDGPGETRGAVNVAAFPGGVALGDVARRRVVVRNDDEGPLQNSALTIPGAPISLVAVGRDSIALVYSASSAGSATAYLSYITRSTGEMGPAIALGDLDERLVPTAGIEATAFTSSVPLAVAGDYLYIGEPSSYHIGRINAARAPSRVEFTFGRPELPSPLISEQEQERRMRAIERQLGTMLGGTTLPPDVRRQLRTAQEADQPHFLRGAMTLDGDGYLWVASERRTGTESELDLFSPDGKFAGSVTVPARIIALAARGDLLAYISLSDDRHEGAHVLHVSRIVR